MADISTDGNDVLTGGSGADAISGGGGNDIINSGAGNDIIDGGSGSDRLNGGSGDDTLVYKLFENANATDLYMGGSGIDTLKLEFTSAEWANSTVQQEIREYLQHLATVKLNATTGEVSNGAASDFTFDFGNGAKLTVSMMERLEVVVNGETINPQAPYITSNGAGSSAAVTIAENTTAVTTVAAFDIDAGTTLTYSLVSGYGDNSLFTLNPTTGVLSFTQAPNFEAAADGGADNVYNVKVQVSDGVLTDTQLIAVSVTDVNEAPSITSGASGSVAENAATSTVIYAATATDVDAGANGNVSYSLSGTDASLLNISTSGEVTLLASANFEAKNSYSFNVIATDGGTPALSDTQAVTVGVTDVNEAPTITSGASGSVAENAATSTVIYAATATDVDAGANGNVSYSLSGADASLLNISTSGEVTLLASANFEAKSSYSFNVIATDGGTPALSDTQAVTVGVTDVNEAPQGTVAGPTGLSFTLDAAQNGNSVPSSGTVIGAFTAIDADGGTFSYAETVDSGNLFTVNSSTGAVTLSSNIVDNATYTLSVQVTDELDRTASREIHVISGGNSTADALTGTANTDLMYGQGQSDTLDAGAGDDYLFGARRVTGCSGAQEPTTSGATTATIRSSSTRL